MEGYHRPVLLSEVLKALEVKVGEWYLDATLGDGGYCLEILKLGGQVVGLDVDPQALKRAQLRLDKYGIIKIRYKLGIGNFRDIKNLIEQTEIPKIKFAGAIFDLGVSSLQLETPLRGFSFASVGPLDMRMDPTLQVKAEDLVNGLNKGELDELFTKLGEEKYSRAIADALVRARGIKKIETTAELAELVRKIYLRFGTREKIHPATRVFQALRIAVNDELNALKEGLAQVKNYIKKDGYIIVVSFHSLEDRIAKFTFRKWESEGFGQVLTKKPVTPTDSELSSNPRSRSSKMRIFKIV